MSRGGRGGFRGGRGGGMGRGGMIGGMEIPFGEFDQQTKLDSYSKPQELFPKIDPPLAAPPTRREKASVAAYRALRDRIHEGPLYTAPDDLGAVPRGTKRGASAMATFDPFEGMETYTQKYKKVKRKIPKLDGRPYVMRFFPEELWSTLDPTYGQTNGVNGDAPVRKKRLQISTGNRLSRLEQLENEQEGQNPDADDEEEPEIDEANKDDQEEEEVDDEFEEDDDDLNDDYNAEQYFENGEEDYDDVGADDGGGGGYDDF